MVTHISLRIITIFSCFLNCICKFSIILFLINEIFRGNKENCSNCELHYSKKSNILYLRENPIIYIKDYFDDAQLAKAVEMFTEPQAFCRGAT